MTPRSSWHADSPLALEAARALGEALNRSALDPRLGELIKIRVSQLNGCAWCLHMHVLDATRMGESDLRLHMLAGWRESPLFDEAERAALAWAESLTRLGPDAAPDPEWEALRRWFSPAEIAELTFLVGAMNLYNRLNVAYRTPHPASAAEIAANRPADRRPRDAAA
ncbi:carboxymuconolactone decarboxylase family protein [Albimonas sp. CAU 1670]|uniref:carboxymuconolactone decarboxylase family protein n=1 Tax=Albimonas sp. CAU 1670 TaxID=3032599 RepID=UPI0023DA119F|nr:carboxymuconolactone decarboxylase family protein [Albimonas sp. CAU 1670]MDF2231421.1 carboxymuconolactone decarboxylase family protein [Albimonas sp. CAU 1670]